MIKKLTICLAMSAIWMLATAAQPPQNDGQQLYNMSFDHWSKDKKGFDVCYGPDATEAQKKVWGSANATTATYGAPTVMPEENFVAVSGPGKKALCLKSQLIKVLFIKKLAAGSIFNGYTGRLDLSKMTAHLHWGIPFSERPTSLKGYACYQPGIVDFTDKEHENLKGKADTGTIAVYLADWDTPFEVCPPDLSLDEENDPGIIGLGEIIFKKKTGSYEPFSIDIQYRSQRTPKYVVIVASASALGDYFTGSTGSVLYLDELEFIY